MKRHATHWYIATCPSAWWRALILSSLLINLACRVNLCVADDDTDSVQSIYSFSDTMLKDALTYPDWFTESFGDLPETHAQAINAGKQGLIVYFGQDRCSYCEKFLQHNMQTPDIVNYLRRNFDITPVNIWSTESIITMDGKEVSERQYAIAENTNFTPSLIFYDQSGEQILRLRGFYPPYTFRAALKYVVEGFYQKESLREYMARADVTLVFDLADLNDEDFFSPPPHHLNRRRVKATRPLVVFFEQGKCHACDILHTGPLADERLRAEIIKLEAVQLDMWSDMPVTTPRGRRTTAKDWANELGLFYAPAMVFFDESGDEIIRVDAVTQFYRLLGVFDYVNSGAYRQQRNYQLWRLSRRKIK